MAQRRLRLSNRHLCRRVSRPFRVSKYMKTNLGFFTSICAIILVFAWLFTTNQAAALVTITLENTPTIQRAPCEGEATRTPTVTSTLTPTLNPRTMTPTFTPTSQNPLFIIPLHYPPNCAVLHRNTL